MRESGIVVPREGGGDLAVELLCGRGERRAAAGYEVAGSAPAGGAAAGGCGEMITL